MGAQVSKQEMFGKCFNVTSNGNNLSTIAMQCPKTSTQ